MGGNPFGLSLSFDKLRMIGGTPFGPMGDTPFGLSLSFDKLRIVGSAPFGLIGGNPFGLSLSKPVFSAVLRQAQDQRPVPNGSPR